MKTKTLLITMLILMSAFSQGMMTGEGQGGRGGKQGIVGHVDCSTSANQFNSLDDLDKEEVPPEHRDGLTTAEARVSNDEPGPVGETKEERRRRKNLYCARRSAEKRKLKKAELELSNKELEKEIVELQAINAALEARRQELEMKLIMEEFERDQALIDANLARGTVDDLVIRFRELTTLNGCGAAGL